MKQDDLVGQAVAQGDQSAIKELLEQVCALTGMGFAAVARVTDARWIACQVLDRIEFGLKPGDELELQTTICNEIRQCGEAVVIDYVEQDLVWRTHATPRLYGFQSYASFPIYTDDGSFYGTLCAIDPAPRDVSDATVIAGMRAFAARAATLLSLQVSSLGTDDAMSRNVVP